MSSSASAMFADTPASPFSRRDSVPRSQPRRAAVSVTFQPTSSMLSRMSSPGCGGFRIGPTRSLARSRMVSAPPLSAIVDQVHVHGLAVLEAEHYASVARGPDAPLARAVTLQGRQPEARRSAPPGCATSCRRKRIRRRRATRPAGSRAVSSRSGSVRSPLCLVFMLDCSAWRSAPPETSVPS